MFKPVRRILSSLPLVAVPALAADGGMDTGITGVGTALFLFTIAGALLLTLPRYDDKLLFDARIDL